MLSSVITRHLEFPGQTEYIGKPSNKFSTLEKNSENLVKAVSEFMEKIDGSYAISGVYRDQFFAFRDPYGIRPLTFGFNEHIAASSSESYVLEFLGIHEWTDVKPGEIVIVKKLVPRNGKSFHVIKQQLAKKNRKAHCMFEWVYFANPCSEIDGLSVYEARLNLGKALAQQIKEKQDEYDYVVPVPDTSKVAATSLAEELKIPFREAIIKNRSLLRTFIIPDEEKRKNAANLKYLFVKKLIKGKKLLVVDDSIVRGLTSKRIVKKLKELGAEKIGFAITSPPQRYPCYYGIDFPKETELIAHNKTIEQIKEELGVDAIYYQTVQSLEASLKPNMLCTACITGKYPTKHAIEIRQLINQQLIPVESSHYEQASNFFPSKKLVLIKKA